MIASFIATSILSLAPSAKADYISLGSPDMYSLDTLCKSRFYYYSYAKELNSYAGVCGVDNSEDRIVTVIEVCNTKFNQTNGVYKFDYDPNENMCKGYTSSSNHGKGNNTIGGAQENPWWNPFGW